MDIFGTILWPIKWAIELIMVAFHTFWTWLGLAPGDGWTWILSLLGLVIVVRSLMIPLMVRQIKSQRSMLESAPEIKKIQDKYKGKKDQFSVEAMRRETMEVYQRTGSNPMSSCWPMLVQMPIFFALFQVINAAQRDEAGVGALNAELAHHFATASVFGAPLSATLINNGGNVTVIAIAVVLVLVMTGSQFFMQRQIMSKNISPATKESPMYRQQQMMLYILPLVFAVSGVAFPIGLMMYWTISNFWTVGQQWVTIRQMPTPGSEAAKAREERLKRRGKWVDPNASDELEAGDDDKPAAPTTTQRQQPMSKSRAKKQGQAAKPAVASDARKDAATEDSGDTATDSDTATAAASAPNPNPNPKPNAKPNSSASKPQAKGGSSGSGSAKSGQAKAGAARSTQKSGQPKSGQAKTGQAKTGQAKSGSAASTSPGTKSPKSNSTQSSSQSASNASAGAKGQPRKGGASKGSTPSKRGSGSGTNK